jgi:hypothetical protein
LSLSLSVEGLIAAFSSGRWNISFPDGNEVQQVTLFFLMGGDVDEGRIRIQRDEIEGYGLFDAGRIPEDTFPCCKEKAKLVAEYLRTRKTVLR